MSIEFSDLENKRILLDCEQADLISIYSIKDRNNLFCIEFWLDLVPSHIKTIGDYNNGNFDGGVLRMVLVKTFTDTLFLGRLNHAV